MWISKIVNLGIVKAQDSKTIIFQYNGDIIIDEKTITSPCSCTNVVWNKIEKRMIVIYKPKAVPEHIKNVVRRDFYHDVKEITFNQIDSEGKIIKQDNLVIQAQVYDNLPNRR